MKRLSDKAAISESGFNPHELMSQSGRWYFDLSRLKFDNLNIRVAIDAAPTAIALSDLAGSLLYANRSFKRLLGIASLEAVIGKNLANISLSLFGGDFIANLAATGDAQCQVLKLNGSSALADRVLCQSRRVDGAEQTPRWLVFTLTRLNDFASVGEQPILASEFAEAEKRSGVAYWSMPCDERESIDDAPMLWSPSAVGLLNLRPGKPLYFCHDWLAQISPGDRLKVRQCLHALVKEGQCFDIEYRLANVSNHRHKIIRSRAWRISQPDIHSGFLLVGSELDVGVQQKKDDDMYRMIALFKSLFEISDSVACVVDKQMRLVYSNQAFRFLWPGHASLKELNADNLLAMFPNVETRRNVVANVRRAMRGQRRAQTVERWENGIEGYHFDLSFNPMRMEQAEVVGVSIIGNVLPMR